MAFFKCVAVKRVDAPDVVELGAVDGGIAMRNSRDPHGPALLYTRDEIAAFIHGVKSGEFDDLIAQP